MNASSSTEIFDDADPSGLELDQIADRLVGHASQIASLTGRFLLLLSEFDRRKGWTGEGIMSCAHWLTLRTGLSMRTAQQYVRVARTLDGVPRIRDAFVEGRLSYSKVRALTRVVTPDREDELLSVALSADAAQLERVVRAIRSIDQREREATEGEVESTASWEWNSDGTLSVRMRLSALDGASFLAATVRAEYERTRTSSDDAGPSVADLVAAQIDSAESPDREAEIEEAGLEPADQRLWRHTPANIAPAVVLMAETMQAAIDVPTFTPGAEVVVHSQSSEADTYGADPYVEGGPALSAAEESEASCGGTKTEVRHGNRGTVTSWGRRTRTPSTRTLRAILARDGGCRYPGCGRTRHLHAHHVRFWSRGGATTPDNLVLLCSSHHRALHRGEFSITAHALQQFTFHRQEDGQLIEQAPPILRQPVGGLRRSPTTRSSPRIRDLSTWATQPRCCTPVGGSSSRPRPAPTDPPRWPPRDDVQRNARRTRRARVRTPSRVPPVGLEPTTCGLKDGIRTVWVMRASDD
ncbi:MULTISPECIES: HNH endonuclease [Gordonia]|uniref:HNH endonuclease n=1 Tax=Gordonia TaxID=2053 RepID=UPI0026C3132E